MLVLQIAADVLLVVGCILFVVGAESEPSQSEFAMFIGGTVLMLVTTPLQIYLFCRSQKASGNNPGRNTQ